jgi:RNA polymerase sigma-70 factor (ECF subfamily)
MNRGIEIIDEGLLLRRMVAGDEAAFTLLYRRRHPAIYRFALHMSGNAAMAEDVTQEVFMTLIRDVKRFDPARGTLGGFLFGIARNHLRRRWEQERNSVPLPETADELDAIMARSSAMRVGGKNGTSGYADYGNENGNGHSNGNGNGNGAGVSAYMLHRDDFALLENVQRVRQAIATLPENYREVVVLCELDELSYEDAAAALDCPVGTVRSRLHRARAILVEKLRDTQPVRRASAVGE